MQNKNSRSNKEQNYQPNSDNSDSQIPYQDDEEQQQPYIPESTLNRKRNREMPSAEQIKNESLIFISKLRECVEEDKQLQRENKPSLEKLKFLPKIRTFLANIHYQREFLEQDGLEVLQNWLKRNRDGTYPPLNQILTILEVLFNLSNIETDHLQRCNIGGYVMEISNSKSVSSNIKNKANELIKKWARIIYKISVDYSKNEYENDDSKYQEFKENAFSYYDDEFNENIHEDNEEDGSEGATKKNKKSTQISLDNLQEYETYNNSIIPKKGLFDFTKKPIAYIEEKERDDINKISYLNSLKKRRRTKKRNYN